MADSYVTQGTKADIQVTGPSTVQNVQIVMATAEPSGVYFEIPVPAASYASGGQDQYLTATGNGINFTASYPNVSGMTFAEDIDTNGLIADYMDVTVEVPTPVGKIGPFTTVVRIPIGVFGQDEQIMVAVVEPLIAAAVAQLNATVGTASSGPTPTPSGGGGGSPSPNPGQP